MFPYCPGHKIPDRLAARAGSGFAVLRKGGAMDAATGSSPLRQGIPSTCATLDWGAYEKRRIYWPGAGRAAGRRAAASCGGQGCSVVPELHPKSWTRKSTKGVQKSMGKELFSEELKLAVVQYVLEGHTRKEASEKFCVSCTPIEKWVNLYKLHGAKGLLSRNLVGRQKGFDGEFRLKVLQYKQEHHLSCTQTAMHFCLDVVTVCRWEKKFQKEGAQGLMKKQVTKSSEKRQKKQEQSELQQENKRLSEENYRLRMENDYLKKLNALIQKREKPE